MYKLDYTDKALQDMQRLKREEPVLVLTTYGHYDDK